jgi:hypothetical protein
VLIAHETSSLDSASSKIKQNLRELIDKAMRLTSPQTAIHSV